MMARDKFRDHQELASIVSNLSGADQARIRVMLVDWEHLNISPGFSGVKTPTMKYQYLGDVHPDPGRFPDKFSPFACLARDPSNVLDMVKKKLTRVLP